MVLRKKLYGNRRKAAQKHAQVAHRCPRCGRIIMGNAYYKHGYACTNILHPDKKGQQYK